jgi:hypothetical protein
VLAAQAATAHSSTPLAVAEEVGIIHDGQYLHIL